jgi:hypothetical protein
MALAVRSSLLGDLRPGLDCYLLSYYNQYSKRLLLCQYLFALGGRPRTCTLNAFTRNCFQDSLLIWPDAFHLGTHDRNRTYTVAGLSRLSLPSWTTGACGTAIGIRTQIIGLRTPLSSPELAAYGLGGRSLTRYGLDKGLTSSRAHPANRCTPNLGRPYWFRPSVGNV